MAGKSKSDAASGSMFMAVLSCLVYSLMSNLMVLMNRYLLISVWSDPLLSNFNFNMLLVLSGVFGIMLNLASFWCVSVTSATTYATVGGLNKIPTTFIGVLLLGEHLKPDTAIYVTFGMIGGLLYSYAKFKEGEEAKRRRAQEARASESKV
ncbi:hypothetical protein P43SY_005721 [Pythium insidiosum]|uniref:Sugar phosphate transporter domain-containing protein n=1 Tax=Pythium insidiosum TaxID=114742 RepID=A0AAD5QAX9_PYTIN|nr:hypothetical protein P43SY_005721 [Pythium insidiosum]